MAKNASKSKLKTSTNTRPTLIRRDNVRCGDTELNTIAQSKIA